MNTKRNARIRKVLYGLVMVGMLVALLGAGGLPAAHAQEGEFPTLPPDKVMPSADFGKLKPLSGASYSPTAPVTLKWETSKHAQYYYFCYDKVNDDRCSGPWHYSDNTDFTINLSGEDLSAGVTYYWQVWACTTGSQPAGCYEADDEKWWSFTTTSRTFYSTGSLDGWILESSETSSAGGSMNSSSAVIILGDDAKDRQYRSILSFNTSGLPDNAVIKSAVLKIKQYGSPVGTDPFSILGNLYASIRKGYFGSSSSLQLADFNAAASAEKIASFGSTPSSGWYSATLNSTGRGKINKTGLTQFRLFFKTGDNDNNSPDYMRFYSGNSSNYQPKLILKYNIP